MYKKLSKEDLIEKIESLEDLIDELKEEKNQEELLNFPWVGNLGNWYWDLEADRVVCNDQKVLALDYKKDEIPDQIGYEFFTSKLHPEDYERVMDNMRDHLEGRSESYEVSYRIQGKYGDWKWYYDRGKITKRNSQGEPVILGGIVFDITNNKKMENEVKKQNEKLLEMIDFDYLTKIYNRQAIFEKLELEMHKSKITGQRLTVALLDIDSFRSLNYTYGYDLGDKILRKIAGIIKRGIGRDSMVGRYDGNSFLILFPSKSLGKASRVSEKIRENIAKEKFLEDGSITVSGGIKEYAGEIPREFLEELGDLSYEAKNNGKNIIVSELGIA